MGYFIKAYQGVLWIGGLRGITRVIAYIKIAILARLLGPEEFGVFGIASLVLAFLEIITETGINAFLIQEGDNLKKYLNTAWVVSVFRGIIIFLILLCLAGPISIFFQSPQSKGVIMIASFIPLIRGFINPAMVKFQKNLEFNKEFYIRLTLFSVDAIVAIISAFILKSAVAFILGMIFSAVLEVLLSFIILKLKPIFLFSKDGFVDVLRRGKWITLSGILNYSYRQGDDVLVGKLMDTYFLGLYQVAYKISTMPLNEASEIFYKVSFPVFVKIRGDKNRLRKAYVRTTLAIFVTVLPFGLALFIFTRSLVLLLLGQDWINTINVVRVLVLYGVVRAITGASSSLFLSVKKQQYNTMILAVATGTMFVLIIPLMKLYGLMGAGIAALTGWLIVTPLILYYTYRILYD
jgi:lipopolysaccharide exporter